MNHDTQELRIAALLDALDQEHARLSELTGQFPDDIARRSTHAIREALEPVRVEVQDTVRTLQRLRRFTWWQAAWRHVATALCAFVITVGGIWAYLPSAAQVATLRAEQASLRATVDELASRGGRIKLHRCGSAQRLCVEVDEHAGRFGDVKKGTVYYVAKGY